MRCKRFCTKSISINMVVDHLCAKMVERVKCYVFIWKAWWLIVSGQWPRKDKYHIEDFFFFTHW